MKKFLIIIWTLLIIPNAYAEIKNCKFILDIDENEEIFESLRDDPNYSYKNANGRICFTTGTSKPYIAFDLKNGKRTGIELGLYYGHFGFEIYLSNYDALDYVFDSSVDNIFDNAFTANKNNEEGPSTLSLLEQRKLSMDLRMLQENGHIAIRYEVKNGKGSISQYLENGDTFVYIPIKNYKFNGNAKIHTASGKLYATLKYKDNKLVSGKCANKRENGAEWTKEEIDNWEKGEYDNDIEELDYCGKLYDLEEAED